MELTIDAFDYDLPPEAVAQEPAEPRDSARLLTSLAGELLDRRVSDLPELLAPGDLLVVNDTKVLPARLRLTKPTGGAVEVLLLEPTGQPNQWQALVRPGRRVKPGQVLLADGVEVAEVGPAVDREAEDGRRLVTLRDPAVIDERGEVPLPPYITQALDDPDRYQTVYARHPGSVAAPTAGLHLTPEILERLQANGVGVARVELRVGLGTFRPITESRVADHRMHTERYRVSPEVWDQVRSAQRVVAIGTTVVRTLESVAATGALEGTTDLFISRGYRFAVVDSLMTNFHVPRSSLLVLLDAFMGPGWKDWYRHALAADYRLLSFGDAMLVDRARDDRVRTDRAQ